MIDPLFSLPISLIVALVAATILIYLEIKRRLKFRWLRIASQFLLVTSIFLLTLRPQLEIRNQKSLLLLTNDYNPRVIDSLKSLKPITFKSYNELSKINGVKTIAGKGLPSWALDLLPSKNYTFIPGKVPEGITAIETDEHIYTNRWNEVCGTYNGNGMIRLRGPGGIEDSVKIVNSQFSLSFFAKAPGRFNYELITPKGNEILPLVIEPERTLNIIIISNYPTFEIRYLKNFLASKGHKLSIRNQVSRGKYKFESANRSAADFQTNDADLLIIDEDSWNSSGAVEQTKIKNSIKDGLGVILIPTEGKSNLIQFNKTNDKDTVKISSINFPALKLRAAASGKRELTGFEYSGAGKIGYQLLSETYQAGLQGKAELYSKLWVPLLEKCARLKNEDFKLRITSPFPYYENEPLSFDIISSGKQPNLAVDNIQLPLTEDVFIDDLWHGTVWLEGSKWHEFAMDSIKNYIQVSKEGSWRSVRATQNIKATQYHSKENGPDNNIVTTYDDTLIKTVLFLIFLMAVGFLWLAPKL